MSALDLAEADAYVEACAQAYETLIGFGVGDAVRDAWRQLRPTLLALPATNTGESTMSTPIFDQLATEASDLICPLCGTPELGGLTGDDDGDLAVCVDCWTRNLNLPERRAERTCVDCGKYCFGLDAHVLVVRNARHGLLPVRNGLLPLCAEHYKQRVSP